MRFVHFVGSVYSAVFRRRDGLCPLRMVGRGLRWELLLEAVLEERFPLLEGEVLGLVLDLGRRRRLRPQAVGELPVEVRLPVELALLGLEQWEQVRLSGVLGWHVYCLLRLKSL